jgi:hypothetical protein
MGAEKWTSAMKRALSVLVLIAICNLASADPGATDKVIQFLTYAHTGQSMRAVDWLGREVRDAPKFKAFGGLDRLVKQSTSRAHAYKGLRSVEILDVAQQGDAYLVKAQVKFIEDHTKSESAAVAEREEMIWNVRVAKENGRWKLWL